MNRMFCRHPYQYVLYIYIYIREREIERERFTHAYVDKRTRAEVLK